MVGLLCKGYLSKILWIINLLAKIRNISWCFCLLLFAVEFCASNLIIREPLKKTRQKVWKSLWVGWGGKFIDKECWLTRKVVWQGYSSHEESQLMRKVDWWGKFIDEKSWWILGLMTDPLTHTCINKQTVH